MNGEILCESKIGMGAKFIFYIQAGCYQDDKGFSIEEQKLYDVKL